MTTEDIRDSLVLLLDNKDNITVELKTERALFKAFIEHCALHSTDEDVQSKARLIMQEPMWSW